MLELEAEAEWSQEGPTLSNDIWKKFQLIPTPPRSPSHETDFTNSDLTLDLAFSPFEIPCLETNDFDLDLDLLPDHLPSCGGPGGLPCAKGTCTSCTQLALAGSELRHDCMWRGTCSAEAHAYHPRDPQHRTHRESTSHFPELLLDPSVLECAAGFTRLDDLDDDEDEEDEDMEVEEEEEEEEDEEDDLAARPDTPSESSETDTDEEQGDEEEEEDDDEGDEAPVVHVDHTYYCPRAPSPRLAHAPANAPTPALPHTPSESEDEIDVVSVGSADSAYSSSSSRSSGGKSSSRAVEKRKRGGVVSRTSGGDPTSLTLSTPTPAVPSTTTPDLPTAAATTTTSFTPVSPRKVLKARSNTTTTTTASTSSKSSRHNRRLHHLQITEKRKATTSSHPSTTTSTNHMTHPPPHTSTAASPTNTNTPYTTRPLKRIHRSSSHHHSHHHHGRKKKNNRGSDDDPERRHLHNSLERMRRVDLRNAFEDLRNLVPDLCDREKAPKVEILRRASEHCYSLTQRERLLSQEKEKQKRVQGELRRRLAALQKQHGRL